MIAFLDTSFIIALLDVDEKHHSKAKAVWVSAMDAGDTIVSSNYVVLETTALVQKRWGTVALAVLVEDLLPVVSVRWVDAETHKAALASLLTANRRNLSLTDCVSFQVMRDLNIKTALTLDKHFKEQGFRLYS